jgi:CheY-like chemotaxis protein
MPTKCILLVEDDADVRLLIEHVLISAGCDVEATGTMLGGTDLLRAAPTTRRRG